MQSQDINKQYHKLQFIPLWALPLTIWNQSPSSHFQGLTDTCIVNQPPSGSCFPSSNHWALNQLMDRRLCQRELPSQPLPLSYKTSHRTACLWDQKWKNGTWEVVFGNERRFTRRFFRLRNLPRSFFDRAALFVATLKPVWSKRYVS